MKKIVFLIINSFVFAFGKNFDRLDVSYAGIFKTSARITEEADNINKLILVRDVKVDSQNKPDSIQIEIYKPLLQVENHSLKLGSGLKFGRDVEMLDKYSSLNYFSPVYFTILYSNNQNAYEYYGKFRVGYDFGFFRKGNVNNFNGNEQAKLKGGIYFSLEDGIVYRSFLLGLGYDFSSTKLLTPAGESQLSTKTDLDYGRVYLTFGYSFKL